MLANFNKRHEVSSNFEEGILEFSCFNHGTPVKFLSLVNTARGRYVQDCSDYMQVNVNKRHEVSPRAFGLNFNRELKQ